MYCSTQVSSDHPQAHYKNPSVILIKSSLNEKSEAWASGKKRVKLIRHLAFYAFRALYIGVKPNEKSIENVQKTWRWIHGQG